jgi:hypothetical protein
MRRRAGGGADAAVQAAVQFMVVADIGLDILEDLFQHAAINRRRVRNRIADIALNAAGASVAHRPNAPVSR